MQTTHQSITPVELNALPATGCCLIDVREPVEHAEESITAAKLIPLGQLERRAAEINRDQPLVVMCRSGKRGAEALKKLQALGFTEVRNLEGGILAWKAAGLPVATGEKKVLPLMQQVQLTIGLGVLTGAILALTVNPNWVFLCAFFGAGLTMAGSTGWCGLAILMSKMPWNRVTGQSCCGQLFKLQLTQSHVPPTNHRQFPRPKRLPHRLPAHRRGDHRRSRARRGPLFENRRRQ